MENYIYEITLRSPTGQWVKNVSTGDNPAVWQGIIKLAYSWYKKNL